MHNIKKKYLGAVIAIIIFIMPLHGHAGTYSATFLNEFQTDAVYLFLYDDRLNQDVRFQDVALTGPSSWGIAQQTDTFLNFSGTSEAGPGDLRFRITFNDDRNNPNIIRGRLNMVASSDFNSTVPTPIPGSTWLLMSGLFFLAGVRRHNRR